MANRMYDQTRCAMEKQVVDLYAVITFATPGSANPVLTRGKGIASVTRTGLGTYSMTLQDTYNFLLGADGIFLKAGDPLAPLVNLLTQTVTTTKIITFQTNTVDGLTPADPAAGEILYLHVALSNSDAL